MAASQATGGNQTVTEAGSGQAAIVISEDLISTIFLLEEFSTVSTANHKHLLQFPVPCSSQKEGGGGEKEGGRWLSLLTVCCQLPRRRTG